MRRGLTARGGKPRGDGFSIEGGPLYSVRGKMQPRRGTPSLVCVLGGVPLTLGQTGPLPGTCPARGPGPMGPGPGSAVMEYTVYLLD